ncbi:MAG TPA: SusD/RagB family nutrient-binding outer membrane lipoprotein, partial [Mucilaginibacter sp.]
MKKTAFIFVLMAIASACTKDMTKFNVDPKHPSTVPSSSLFTTAERQTAVTVTSASVDLNIFRLIEQQWTETTYLNETDYQFTYRKQPDELWTQFYTNTLINFEKAKSFIATDATDAGTKKNEDAIIDILEVYNYYYLVTS